MVASNIKVFNNIIDILLFQACDDIFEPKLDELINQLREIGGLLNHRLTDHLTSRLSSLSSPDDLFNFFSDMRGMLIVTLAISYTFPLLCSFSFSYLSITFLLFFYSNNCF